ncbi:unnamed protein product [Bathycoccus prasinos]
MCLLFNKYLHQRCAHNLFGEARVEDVESFVEGITQNHHPTTTTRKKSRFESVLDEAIERKGLTFFTDVPFFMPGMPCRLLVEYPEARFLYVHRDRMEHFDSVLRMHCKWDAPINCLNANNKALRELSWGSYFQTFCDEHSKICGEKGDEVQKNNLTSLMSSIWLAHLEDYEQSVRECIPTSKLLNISLGWYNETSETKLFQSFFELPEDNNDSLALHFSRLHINDDLMPRRRQRMFNKWRPLIMLTGPAQSSTLVSGAMRKALNETFEVGIKKICPKELINPACQTSNHRAELYAKCIRGIQECLGHFFHSWHLITVAKSLNVPVFSVESLLLSNSRDEALIVLKASGACTSLSIGSAEMYEAFVDNLREMQSVPTWMRVNVTEIFKDASSFSSVSLMLDREKKYYEHTKCAPVLSTLTSWCRDNIKNCATVSDVYSGATVGTTLDYLSPLKQGGMTNIDEIFNRTLSPRGLLLPGGEEKWTTEAKRLQDSVVYAAVIMGAFFTLAGLVRFFRSRKSLEVVQVI